MRILCHHVAQSPCSIDLYLKLFILSQGRIFIEPTLPELTPPERAAAYRQLATTLAALHSVKPQAVNLQRYGRPSGYCARQVSNAVYICLGLHASLHVHIYPVHAHTKAAHACPKWLLHFWDSNTQCMSMVTPSTGTNAPYHICMVFFGCALHSECITHLWL